MQVMFLCTAVSKFSAFPNFGRWGVLVRMTWVGLPMGRAQLGSVGKPKEGFFDRKDICSVHMSLARGREEDRERFRNCNLLTAFFLRNPEELVLLKTGLFSSPVKQECLSNSQTHSNTH